MNAVVFDMDGLMFDTEKVFVEAWDYAGEKAGLGKLGYMSIRTLGMNEALINSIWLEEFGIVYETSDLRKYSKEFINSYYEHNKVPIKKGLIPLLHYLKNNNYKLAVASSSPKRVVHKHLKDANVFDEFDGVICGDMIANSKPAPDIYIRACEILGEEPSSCYALEDSINGIISSHTAGCKAIMIPDLLEPTEEAKTILHRLYKDLDEFRMFLQSQEE